MNQLCCVGDTSGSCNMRLQRKATTWCAHPVSHLVLPVVAPYVLEVLANWASMKCPFSPTCSVTTIINNSSAALAKRLHVHDYNGMTSKSTLVLLHGHEMKRKFYAVRRDDRSLCTQKQPAYAYSGMHNHIANRVNIGALMCITISQLCVTVTGWIICTLTR